MITLLIALIFSNHSIISRMSKHKVTDLGYDKLFISENNTKIETVFSNGDFFFINGLKIEDNLLKINKKITIENYKNYIIRPLHFTFHPESWDRNSLFIETHNGGNKIERFDIKSKKIDHGNLYSELISATNCFGNSEGVLIVGDKTKRMVFKNKMATCALIPFVTYVDLNDTFFFRLIYSFKEIDETAKAIENNPINIELSVGLDC